MKKHVTQLFFGSNLVLEIYKSRLSNLSKKTILEGESYAY